MTENNENKTLSVKKWNNSTEMIMNCPENQTIADNLMIAWSKINSPIYNKIVCTVSGGSDSDVMLDMIWRMDIHNKVDFVWFDTGLEYQATKDHLKELEEKYGITIKTRRATKSIPLTCREYGQPFISKYVSEMGGRLQRHGFDFVDKPYEELVEKYSKCKAALKWWCNENVSQMFNIDKNKYLKEFMVANPPTFKMSSKCCQYAKKDVIHKLLKEEKYDLSINGVRRAEGGIRSAAYKSCFDVTDKGYDNYRPLFWYTNADKQDYEEYYGITNSKCYSVYGLTRTGCSGCPFGRDFEFELNVIDTYEPKLYKAVNNIFGDSYEYTRKYREFVKKKREEESKGR